MGGWLVDGGVGFRADGGWCSSSSAAHEGRCQGVIIPVDSEMARQSECVHLPHSVQPERSYSMKEM